MTRKKGNQLLYLKCMVLKKLKANSQCWNIKNFKHRSQKEMYYPKKIKCYDFCAKAKWKASKFRNQSLVEGMYVHFYNWDRPLDLVSIVYNLIELIIEDSLWSKDYSTFDTHLQHTRLCSNNAYLICAIVYVQMWYVCSCTYWSNPKIFLSVLYVF